MRFSDLAVQAAVRAYGALCGAVGLVLCALILFLTLPLALPARVLAEQASEPTSPAAGRLDAGGDHSCAVLASSSVRCWGFGGDGRLGYGNLETIGDYEAPGSVGPVDLGVGRTAVASSAGGFHTCAILDVDASVRCWGSSAVGQLGYGNTSDVGDNESPGSAGPVDLGTGRTAQAITAGFAHTCAILNLGDVRCWGRGAQGRLGYAGNADIGDDETPGSVGPVDLGSERTATAISAGSEHTCALLDDWAVRCWGVNFDGQLGYRNPPYNVIYDPSSVGPVDLGPDRTARAITTGAAHTCAILDDASVRCWGRGSLGQLGYGNTQSVGDDESPGSVGPVDLGPGRTAKAISAGAYHTCAVLDNGSVRCWGFGGDGRLGYGRTEFGGLNVVGDNEVPGSVGPVDLGPGRTAIAISAGGRDTCARLDDGDVRCWGNASTGQLGNCSVENIGDDETPGSAGPVALDAPAGGGSGCVSPAGGSGVTVGPRPTPGAPAKPDGPPTDGRRAEAVRRRGLRSCRLKAARHTRREIRRARRSLGARRARAKRHLNGHRSQLRRRCLRRWGRTPGRVSGLKARAVSGPKVVLTFSAPGTDGSHPPAARTYLLKQSRRPIHGSRGFRGAQTLCRGSCRFATTRVGAALTLTVAGLRPRSTYYYAVAARDNVSRRVGPRSQAVKVRTR